MMIKVKYIGPKEKKVDNVAGTGLSWGQGEVHSVPPVAAAKLLAHPNVWALDEDSKPVTPEAAEQAKQEEKQVADEKLNTAQTLEEQAVNPAALPPLNMLEGDALDKIALDRYGHTFRKNASDQSKREKITELELTGKALA